MAGRTFKEWVSDNIEHVKQQQKEYREANKEPRAHIKTMHYQRNKVAILQKDKQYRENNTETLKQKAEERKQKPMK